MNIESIADAAANHGKSELARRVGYLDGWRGLAIALVLQHHFFGIHSVNSGRLGVDIFFCLSGFLMSQILFVKRVSLGVFYKRRISRIMPSFLLYVLTVYGIAYAAGHAPGWDEFVPTLLFLRAYMPAQPHMFSTGYPIAHLWSLNVEEHCYVLLSALTLLVFLKGREGLALVIAGVLSIAIHGLYMTVPDIAPPSGGYWIRTETAAANLLLSAGYCLLRSKTAPFVKPWMPLAAFVLGAAFYSYPFHWMLPMLVSPFLLAFAINHLDKAPNAIHSILSAGPLRLLGIYSYSIYLWQQPFYIYQETYVHAVDAQRLVFLAVALGLGTLMFYAFENPARCYLNRVW